MNGRDTMLLLAVLTVALALMAGCTSTEAPSTPTPTPSAIVTSTGSETVTIDLVAQNIAYDRTEIAVPACAEVVINFENRDAGIPHNFALYTDSQAKTAFFRGEIITGDSSIQYTFTAPCTPGDYYFRCDPHPNQMFGTLTVV